VALLLEVARDLKRSPPGEACVVLVFSNGEELGYSGGQHAIEALGFSKLLRSRKLLAVAVDTVGRGAGKGLMVFAASDPGQPDPRPSAADVCILENGCQLTAPGARLPFSSELDAFEEAGLSRALLTAGNSHLLHGPDDTAETLDYENIIRGAKVLEGWIRAWGRGA
jgi:Zn-dependent M28 family amino/carboxypeptidase